MGWEFQKEIRSDDLISLVKRASKGRLGEFFPVGTAATPLTPDAVSHAITYVVREKLHEKFARQAARADREGHYPLTKATYEIPQNGTPVHMFIELAREGDDVAGMLGYTHCGQYNIVRFSSMTKIPKD